jgi:hypothetical protein
MKSVMGLRGKDRQEQGGFFVGHLFSGDCFAVGQEVSIGATLPGAVLRLLAETTSGVSTKSAHEIAGKIHVRDWKIHLSLVIAFFPGGKGDTHTAGLT